MNTTEFPQTSSNNPVPVTPQPIASSNATMPEAIQTPVQPAVPQPVNPEPVMVPASSVTQPVSQSSEVLPPLQPLEPVGSLQPTPESVVQQPNVLPPVPATPIPVQPASMPPAEVPNIKKSSKKPLILAIVLILVIIIALVAGGLVYAYQSNTDVPVFSGIVEKIEKLAVSDKQFAQQLTAQAATSLDSLKTTSATSSAAQSSSSVRYVKYDFTIAADWPANQSGDAVSDLNTFNFSGSGAIDSQAGNLKANLDSALTVKAGGVTVSPTLNLMLSQTSDNTLAFVKLGSLPSSVLQGLTSINNKWIGLDYNELKQEFGVPSTSTTPTTTIPAISSADIDKLKTFIQSDPIVNNFRRDPDQIVNGVRTNCFTESFDSNTFPDLINELKNLNPDSLGSSLNNANDNTIKSFNISACVGRRDQYLYKFNLTLSTNSPTDSNLSFALNFKDYNVPVTIDQPTTDLTVKDLLQLYVQNYYQSGLTSSPSNLIDGVLNQTGL